MKSIKLVSLSGIIGKVRGLKEKGKSRLEETRQAKCNKLKMQCERSKPKTVTALPPHLATVFGDGLPREARGRGLIGGQDLAVNWSRFGQNLAINTKGIVFGAYGIIWSTFGGCLKLGQRCEVDRQGRPTTTQSRAFPVVFQLASGANMIN